ncbi:CBS domain-containing protein [Kitasatospora sp. NPDC058965]|uniref:CBS domain-containing protein n=1 Tax=Kitasatospora sp. NPDC058965 TaxID=3346682 RepID=UPI00367B95DB
MRHRPVTEVMTSEVVRVSPGTGFREIVALLAESGITAVPVVDADGRPVGVVSEADLMCTQAAQDDPAGALAGPSAPAGERVTAGELMSSPAVCIGADATVVAAARTMQRRGVKRLPVVDTAGRLVGIVSRADVLRVFLRSDRAIRQEIVEEVLGQVAGVSPAAVGVEVDQGRVVLSGSVDQPYLAPIVVRLCRAVDGVVAVTDRIDRPGGTAPADPAA